MNKQKRYVNCTKHSRNVLVVFHHVMNVNIVDGLTK